jgi:DNA-binding XRE family transcriptional regulator
MCTGIKKLRANPRIQKAAEAYFPSLAYRGGMGFFKATGMSTTEYIALKNIEFEKRKRLENSSYQIRDISIFDGKTSSHIARITGVGKATIDNVRKGNYGVCRKNAELIARFFKKSFDEIFEIFIEKIPVGYAPDSRKLTDSDYFKNYARRHLTAENLQKIKELGLTVNALESSVVKLRRGLYLGIKSAKNVAFVFGENFEEMFVPI